MKSQGDRSCACSRCSHVIHSSHAYRDRDDVLEDRPKRRDASQICGSVLRQLDHLRVAATSKLKMPRSLHPCSSSPMSPRCGSLGASSCPCPRDRRKRRSPSLPTFAEQCIDRTLERERVVENREIDFLIRPLVGAGDEHELLSEVDEDGGLAAARAWRGRPSTRAIDQPCTRADASRAWQDRFRNEHVPREQLCHANSLTDADGSR